MSLFGAIGSALGGIAKVGSAVGGALAGLGSVTARPVITGAAGGLGAGLALSRLGRPGMPARGARQRCTFNAAGQMVDCAPVRRKQGITYAQLRGFHKVTNLLCKVGMVPKMARRRACPPRRTCA